MKEKIKPTTKWDSNLKKVVPIETATEPVQQPDIIVKHKKEDVEPIENNRDGYEQKFEVEIPKGKYSLRTSDKNKPIPKMKLTKITTTTKISNKIIQSKKIKVSTYSRESGLSLTSIYKGIEKGTIKSETIDGVRFVVIEK
jgi:hypothetical protein